MTKDREILKELEQEIGAKLPQIEPDKIGILSHSESSFGLAGPGFAVDEYGHVAGMNLHFNRGKEFPLRTIEVVPITLLKLHHLKKISFFNVAISDFSLLEKLPGLSYLSILFTSIRDVSFLNQSLLTTLMLRNNKIDDIFTLGSLSNLEELDLSDNQINDISALAGLSNLEQLYLSRNRVIDISPVCGLKNLTRLALMGNDIKRLPEAILDLGLDFNVDDEYGGKGGIFLYGNPLESPPPEIIRKGRSTIRAYFKSLEKGERLPLNEVKVLLVGDGGAGKTSLVKCLTGETFDPEENQTDGINISRWPVIAGETDITAHLWDFGGQEIMHATHQFFLSERSFYVLVLDSRQDKKPEYWLKHIRSFGGDSPVLVVLNKIDENPGFEVNRQFLQEKYPNIKGFYRLSCAKNKGVKEFSRALKKALCEVEIIRTTWAANWFRVKQHLEGMEDPFISYQEYREICHREQVTGKDQQDTLVDFLNDLGVILHFKELDLKGVHVLEPKWVTEAVYKIINSEKVAESKGILKTEFLDQILKQTRDEDYYYPPEKYHYIIQLMKKFELCYEIDKDTVLIPDLLDVQQSRFTFDYKAALRFHFQYDFLPRSVMPRFIVRMHSDIKNECRWRTGVLLANPGFKATAVVKADNEEKRVLIYVTGEQKRDYFSVIRHTLRAINGSFDKLHVVEKVPLPDHPAIAVDYEELTGYEEVGEAHYLVGVLKKRYPVKLLLDGIEKEEERQKRDSRKIQSVTAGGDVTIFNMEGDHSNFNVNISRVEQTLELIVKQLADSDVVGKEELIEELRDENVKKDKARLRGVLGKVLTRAAEIGTIVSLIASILK